MIQNGGFPDPPPPYTMCSREECQERQASGEISWFERSPLAAAATVPTTSLGRALQRSQNTPKSAKQQQTKQQYQLDPRYAVAKYRRSAAGMTDKRPVRSLPQLVTTVRYLQQLLVAAPDMSPDPCTTTSSSSSTMESSSSSSSSSSSWLLLVEFVQDRFRAIQVELIVGGYYNSNDDRSMAFELKGIQYHMARTQLLILYLLADVPAYSLKFGQDALQTSLVNYWNGCGYSSSSSSKVGGEEQDETSTGEAEMDDEIMSYILLLSWRPPLNDTDEIPSNNSDSSSWLSFSQIFRQNSFKRQQQGLRRHNMSTDDWPRLQWTLQLSARLRAGHWQTALHQLATNHKNNSNSSTRPGVVNDTKNKVHMMVLIRCCVAPHVPWIRYKALQAYNYSWQKGQAVAAVELARLLCFASRNNIHEPNTPKKTAWDDDNDDNSDNNETQTEKRILQNGNAIPSANESLATRRAFEFGQSIGLPVADGGERTLRFKVAPLQPATGAKTRIRDEDDFVFGGAAAVPMRRDQSGVEFPSLEWMRHLFLLD